MTSNNPLPESDYTFMPVEEAVNPAKGSYFERQVNSWWLVHPEKGLAFYNPLGRNGRRRRSIGAPQCNTNKLISEMVAKGASWPYEIRFFETVWVPVDPSEWGGL